MLTELWKYVLRRPRHQVAQRFLVEVHRASAAMPGPVEAELVNLSRQGFQLRMSVPLTIQESIGVRLRVQQANLDVTLPGIVQWQQSDDGGKWLVGCQAVHEVEWETLGELFLNGVLAVDNP